MICAVQGLEVASDDHVHADSHSQRLGAWKTRMYVYPGIQPQNGRLEVDLYDTDAACLPTPAGATFGKKCLAIIIG